MRIEMKIDPGLVATGTLAVLVIITAGFSVNLYYRLERLETKNNQLMQALMEQRSNDPRGNRDPYLKKQVKNTIMKNSGQVLACYEDYMKRLSTDDTPDFPRVGNVTIDWQIDKNGNVISPAIVRSAFQYPVFKQALIDTVKSWPFPPPLLGINKYVEHTFRFQDADSKK